MAYETVTENTQAKEGRNWCRLVDNFRLNWCITSYFSQYKCKYTYNVYCDRLLGHLTTITEAIELFHFKFALLALGTWTILKHPNTVLQVIA